MSGSGGTLVHIGDPSWGDILSLEAKKSGAYEDVLHYSTAHGAVEELSQLSKEQLGSIRTFIVDDRMPSFVEPSRKLNQQLDSLLKGGESPDLEMRAGFVAGKIKQIYKGQGLTPPPVIMGTVLRDVGTWHNIDGSHEYSGEPDNARDISELSNALAGQQRRRGRG